MKGGFESFVGVDSTGMIVDRGMAVGMALGARWRGAFRAHLRQYYITDYTCSWVVAGAACTAGR